MNILEGFTEFDYQNPPEIEKPLIFKFFDGDILDGDILDGVLTWDEERKTYVFYSEGEFYDIDDVEFWKYK